MINIVKKPKVERKLVTQDVIVNTYTLEGLTQTELQLIRSLFGMTNDDQKKKLTGDRDYEYPKTQDLWKVLVANTELVEHGLCIREVR